MWAHPRVSGENACSALVLAVSAGSSPRERGKHVYDGLTRVGQGLIPA